MKEPLIELKNAAHLHKFMQSVPCRKFFFASDIAAGTIKLVSGLTGTVSFLRNLESLYDSFGIGAHTIDASQLSLQDAVCNVSSVNALKKQSLK